jgi:hypothetical protein
LISDGTLTVPYLDFTLMRRKVGIPTGDVLKVIESFELEQRERAHAIISTLLCVLSRSHSQLYIHVHTHTHTHTHTHGACALALGLGGVVVLFLSCPISRANCFRCPVWGFSQHGCASPSLCCLVAYESLGRIRLFSLSLFPPTRARSLTFCSPFLHSTRCRGVGGGRSTQHETAARSAAAAQLTE